MPYDAIIVGAGIAGLTCARYLEESGLSYIVLEAEDRPGGRIKTDNKDGYLLDRGFQVLQTGYPEAQRTLNYASLDLKKFPAGVAVRHNGSFHIIADPRHHPRHLISTVASPIGTLKDRILMATLARSVGNVPFEELFIQPEQKTIDYLKNWGFSHNFIERFFVPFFAGACLDRKITASSRVLRYIFRVFAEGDAALPAQGMEAIPRQLAGDIPESRLSCNAVVTNIDNEKVTLAGGQEFEAKIVVLATANPDTCKLVQSIEPGQSIGEKCFYFAADWLPPFNEPFLILNGDGRGPINNIAFPSLVAPRYSANGHTLIAVVVLEDAQDAAELHDQVVNQCHEWFGSVVKDWDHIHTAEIHHALPNQEPPTPNPYELCPPVQKNLRICGEHQNLPGTQWSLLSGRLTAEAVIADLMEN